MPRHDKPRTLLGFDPYGYDRYLLPLPEGNPCLGRHYLGTAEIWVQIDTTWESFYLERFGDYWHLSNGDNLLARALAERLPNDPSEVGELLLTELWCIRWPVAMHMTGCDDPDELGKTRWTRIQKAYDDHLEKAWTPQRVEQVLAVKEKMRRAFFDDKPGKVWAVQVRNRSDARWCLENDVPCAVRRRDDGKTLLLEFDTFDAFSAFQRSQPARSAYPAWIQHADGKIQELEVA